MGREAWQATVNGSQKSRTRLSNLTCMHMSGDVQLQGIQYVLLLCAVSQELSIPYQFLENRSEQSCMQFSGLRS